MSLFWKVLSDLTSTREDIFGLAASSRELSHILYVQVTFHTWFLQDGEKRSSGRQSPKNPSEVHSLMPSASREEPRSASD